MKIVLIIMMVIVAFLILVYVNHRVQSKKEEKTLTPMGQMVTVDGHDMCVYSGGTGNVTLVFLSGGGTCAPILDFQSLDSLLLDDYKVAVVERFGYGFSDVTDKSRRLDSVLEDTRQALKEAGCEAPYVLCPHSMSGLEALYWVQTYPDEVQAIIGLDMAVPEYYADMKVNMPMLKLTGAAARIGLTRLIPGVWEGDAVKRGTLSDKEKETYQALFYRKTATETMLNEYQAVGENARMVAERPTPQVPMLLFVSNGTGTGFDTDTWRKIPEKYLADAEDGQIITLDCPHYVQDYEYEKIAGDIEEFLQAKM